MKRIKMKIEKTYKENGIKIIRIEMKKSRKKNVINSKSKRVQSNSKIPSGPVISSIYNSKE